MYLCVCVFRLCATSGGHILSLARLAVALILINRYSTHQYCNVVVVVVTLL